jgi:hypothetical protein
MNNVGPVGKAQAVGYIVVSEDGERAYHLHTRGVAVLPITMEISGAIREPPMISIQSLNPRWHGVTRSEYSKSTIATSVLCHRGDA